MKQIQSDPWRLIAEALDGYSEDQISNLNIAMRSIQTLLVKANVESEEIDNLANIIIDAQDD